VNAPEQRAKVKPGISRRLNTGKARNPHYPLFQDVLSSEFDLCSIRG